MPVTVPRGSQRRVADTGVQLERTLLAWQRTALLVGVNGGLLLKAGMGSGAPAIAAGVAVCLTALIMWILPALAYRTIRGTTASSVVGSHRLPMLLATATTAIIALVNGLVLLLHG